MPKWRYTSLITLIVFPGFVSAEVLISEIAWMGSAASHSDEWIELYNQSDTTIDVGGWSLNDNDALEIELSGSIGPHEHVVLERTDENSAPGSSFLIYTGALGNDGATLTLRRGDGSVSNEVVGGEGWENIGGNNETKETAQFTSSGWITAPPTPGAPNDSDSSNETDDTDEGFEATSENESSDQEDTEEDDSGSGVGETISLELPDNELQLAIDAPSVGYVNQPLSFKAHASGIGDSLLASLSYEWNFGDMHTANAKDTTHSYAFPGTYVVVLGASYARHEAEVRHEVTILPIELSMSRDQNANIVLQNEAEHELDLGGLSLVGDERITIPQNTILPAQDTLTIARSRLENGAQKMIALYDRDGVLVTSNAPVTRTDTRPAPSRVAAAPSSNVRFASDASAQETVEAETNAEIAIDEQRPTTATRTLSAAVSSSDTGLLDGEKLPYIFFAGIILLGLAGIYARRFSP